MTLAEKIQEYLDGLGVYELLNLYDAFTNYDERVYHIDEFDDVFCDTPAWNIVRAAFYGDFRPCDSFFRFDGYGNLESTNYMADWISTEDMAAYCAENRTSLDDEEIQRIIDEYEE